MPEELYVRLKQNAEAAADIMKIEASVLNGSLEPSLAADALIEKLSAQSFSREG